jgi:hypothetical protein
MFELVAEAVAAEREACAKVCEDLVLEHVGRADLTRNQCVNAIREGVITMSDLYKAAEQALEALENEERVDPYGVTDQLLEAIEPLRAALAQPSIKDTRDEEVALLREEIKRLRFCIPEGDAAAAMEYLAYCVEKAVAAERERYEREIRALQFQIDELKYECRNVRARGESK